MTKVAIVGGGLIGAGWAGAFAGAGHETIVLDPDPESVQRVADGWSAARTIMERLGNLAETAVAPRVVRHPEELDSPGFVQEALPESLALKNKVLPSVEKQVSAETIIASSSSSFTADDIARGLARPQNVLIGHPCNPPYLMPVVEIVGGKATAPETLANARGVYEGIGKTVLEMKKAVPGHLVNRLQAALWREAVHLVATGAASLEETERAVTLALAPRWCLVGPSSVFALAGGKQGMAGFLEALGEPFEALWDDLGTPRLDAKTRNSLVTAFDAAGLPPLEEVAKSRDAKLSALLKVLSGPEFAGPQTEKTEKNR
jgi:3-hydroxyacyl-CoA dehydrogenase